MNKILVYGSLRPEFIHVYGRRVADSFAFGHAHKINGYKMFDNGSYPYIVKTEDKSDSITVIEADIQDDNVASSIRRMELNAGYRADTISVAGAQRDIYVFDGNESHMSGLPVVESGDWLVYNRPEDAKMLEF